MYTLKLIFLTILIFVLQTQMPFLNLTVVLIYVFSFINRIQKQSSNRKSELKKSEIVCTLFGFLIGLIEDIISNHIIGPAFFSKGLIGFLTACLVNDRLPKQNFMINIVYLIIFTLADNLISVAVKNIFEDLTISIDRVLQLTLMQIFLTVPIGLFFLNKEYRQ